VPHLRRSATLDPCPSPPELGYVWLPALRAWSDFILFPCSHADSKALMPAAVSGTTSRARYSAKHKTKTTRVADTSMRRVDKLFLKHKE
jgi:hypothetical protein